MDATPRESTSTKQSSEMNVTLMDGNNIFLTIANGTSFHGVILEHHVTDCIWGVNFNMHVMNSTFQNNSLYKEIRQEQGTILSPPSTSK